MPERGPGEPGFRPWRVAWADALYGEGGFYRRPEGPRGHFETSANAPGGVVELLAQSLVTLADRHGCTQLVDVGAGRGELLTALAATEGLRLTGVDVVRRPPGLPGSVRWVESPGGAGLPPELRDLDRVLVLAHEWLDVVPCDVLEVDLAGELRVVEVDRAGRERLGGPPTAEQLDWCARWWPVPGLEPGARVEVGLARDAAWAGLVGRVRSGVLVAVDYGHLAADRPPQGSLAAHRAGRLVPPVPDGSCDLTAELAWDSLSAAGAAGPAAGRAASLTTQREMLMGLGVDAGRPGRPPAGMEDPGPGAGGTGDDGGGGDGPAAYLSRLQRSAAAAILLDPGGLGGLGWLVQEVATGQADPPPARVGP